jgi:hypothetical protein
MGDVAKGVSEMGSWANRGIGVMEIGSWGILFFIRSFFS